MTREEFAAEIAARIGGRNRWDELKVETTFPDGRCEIAMSKMYQGIGDCFDFATAKWISEVLKTDKINIGEREYRPGCESCDHGSRDSLTVYIEEPVFDETTREAAP